MITTTITHAPLESGTYRAWLAALLFTTMLVATGAAVTDDAFADGDRPKPNVLRQNEDWSVLAGQPRDGRFDAMKFVPLSDDESVWMSFGGQIRERMEFWKDFGFGGPEGADRDDEFLVSRIRFHGDLHLGPHVRLFAEGKSSLATDRDLPGGRRTLEVDELDLQNGFLEIKAPAGDSASIALRAGRQELLYGKQRLVSPLDWANTRRTFDGFTATASGGTWTASGFFTRPVMVEKYDFNDTNDDVDFYGIYANSRGFSGGGADVYWLALDRPMAAFNGTSGAEERHTVGGRLYGNIAGSQFDYDVEGAYQFGDVGDADIEAFMFASQVGTTFTEPPCKPRVEIGFDYASGDDEADDNDVETFNQLFPLGHAYLGYIDAIGRQNIVDARLTTAFNVVTPVEALSGTKIKFDVHYFWRAEDTDAVYNAGGAVMRAGNLGTSSDVGMELDLTVKKAISAHTLVVVGYSHFFAGDFIEESGPDQDIDFGYVIFQYTI